MAKIEVKNQDVRYALGKLRSIMKKTKTIQKVKKKRYFLSKNALENFKNEEKAKERKKQKTYREHSANNSSHLLDFFNSQINATRTLFQNFTPPESNKLSQHQLENNTEGHLKSNR